MEDELEPGSSTKWMGVPRNDTASDSEYAITSEVDEEETNTSFANVN